MTESATNSPDSPLPPRPLDGLNQPDSAAPETPLARYERRAAEAERTLRELEGRERRLRVARLACFLAFVLTGAAAWDGGVSGWLLCIPFAAFVAMVRLHEKTDERSQVVRLERLMHRRQRARLQRDWPQTPAPAAPDAAVKRPVARDLDLFGPRSVFHWLCTAQTSMGREILADWLLDPADASTIAARQPIVRALANEPAWRESLQLHGLLLENCFSGPRQFVDWAGGDRWLASRPGLRRAAPLVGLLTLLAVAGVWGKVLPPAVGLTTLACTCGLSFALSFLHLGKVHDIFDAVAGRSDEVGKYLAMLEVAARLPDRVGPVEAGDRDLRRTALEAIDRLAKLRRITQIAGLRRSGLFGLPLLILQWTLLWEFHLLAWLEAWQRKYGAEAAAWFDAIGRLEALASLATAAADEPHWTFPTVDPAADRLSARGLAHPLIPAERRTANDVELGPPGVFLLVTGSNMSGKSTLLRSIGVNVMLAQAGGPVCAVAMTLPPVEVATSMRVSDSLADGVSFFFAELLRLKQIVDRAKLDEGGERKLLFLLDEILQGTNSRERQTAVARVVGHLLEHRAIGAVSTHDLELAAVPPLAEACRPVHFRETLAYDGQRRTMSFDYQLRPGLSPTTNALILLEMVGLGDDA